jgi:hypothetical protein
MFIIHWVFDKFGYMPKIDMQVGKVNIEAAWPFPAVSKDFAPREEPKTKSAVKKKPAAKKVIVPKKPKVAAKTARTKTK